MRTKDWKAINTPQILVVGEDSNLQWSETVAKYAMFADYYFRNFPEDHGERSRNVESRNLFDYIMELTGHQLTPEDVYITNLCNDEVEAALNALTKAAETNEGNLLELSIDAARKHASLGEISTALEKIYGRYKAVIRSISGVYSSESKDDDLFRKACALADKFAGIEGRRPRIMIAKMGQDGHDRGAKVVATGYADIGFDVDVGPLFQTPAEAAKQAVENDVYILGVSSLAAGHKTLVPQVIEELKKHGREDIMVIVGGVIPPQDYDFLYKAGAVAIFGPGTSIPDAALKMLEIMLASRER